MSMEKKEAKKTKTTKHFTLKPLNICRSMADERRRVVGQVRAINAARSGRHGALHRTSIESFIYLSHVTFPLGCMGCTHAKHTQLTCARARILIESNVSAVDFPMQKCKWKFRNEHAAANHMDGTSVPTANARQGRAQEARDLKR